MQKRTRTCWEYLQSIQPRNPTSSAMRSAWVRRSKESVNGAMSKSAMSTSARSKNVSDGKSARSSRKSGEQRKRDGRRWAAEERRETVTRWVAEDEREEDDPLGAHGHSPPQPAAIAPAAQAAPWLPRSAPAARAGNIYYILYFYLIFLFLLLHFCILFHVYFFMFF